MDSARKAGHDLPAIDRPNVNCYGRLGLRRNLDAPTRRFPSAWRLLVPAACALALGCGPIEYINQVGNRAASAVSAAKLASAERYAPYEYTAAAEYLHKAREEAGHSQYEDAIDYGHKAEELADRARAIAVERMAKEAETAHYRPKNQNEEPAPAPEKGETPPGTP
jgi:hypothetical protein